MALAVGGEIGDAVGGIAVAGAAVGVGFAFAGLPWWIGAIVAAVVGLTPFATAGVVAFLGGAIWLFAVGELIGGVWLFLFAMGLMLLAPLLGSLIRRGVPEAPPPSAAIRPQAREEGVPFVLMVVGVAGGMIAFGFIGLFLGPVLLALGYDLVRELAQGPGAERGAKERREP